MFTTDLVNLYIRNIFKTSQYIYIFQDEKSRLMRNLSLSMIKNQCLQFWKMIIFICGFITKINWALYCMKTLIKNWNTFIPRKTTIFIRKRFKGYRCTSGNCIIVWRVSWNFTDSPFNISILYFFRFLTYPVLQI